MWRAWPMRARRSSSMTWSSTRSRDRYRRGVCERELGQLRCPSAGLSGVLVLAGDGDDMVTSSSSLPTIVDGGGGDDVLLGSNGPDTLEGGAGQDVLEGAGGPDLLRGGD